MRSKPRPSRRRVARRCGRTRRWCWWPGCVRVRGSHGGGPVVASVWRCYSSRGSLNGGRRSLVLGDGAASIRAWFESLGISLQAMIVCWWHLRKRCYEQMSSAGGPKHLRRTFENEAAGAVVGREGECGDRTSEGGIGVGEEPCRGRGTHRVPGEAASVYPQLPATATGGVMDRQHTVEKYNDWRCRHAANTRG